MEHSSELWDLMTSYLETSPATNPLRWLKWSADELLPKDSSIFEKQAEKFDTFPVDFPHVTLTTVKLVILSELDQKKNKSKSVYIINVLYRILHLSNMNRYIL